MSGDLISREEFRGYINHLTPSDRRQLIATAYRIVRRKILKDPKRRVNAQGDLSARAEDYVQAAIAFLTDSTKPALELPDGLNAIGLIINQSFFFYLTDRQRENRSFHKFLEYQAYALIDQEDEDRFPEERWDRLMAAIHTLDEAEQALIQSSLRENCFRVGKKRVQFDNNKIAKILGVSPRDASRRLAKIKERLGQIKDDEGEDEGSIK